MTRRSVGNQEIGVGLMGIYVGRATYIACETTREEPLSMWYFVLTRWCINSNMRIRLW